MTANNKNVYAAEPLATGTCFVAETGTTGPTNASASLNPGFTDLGNIGEDGFTESMARTTDEKKNFGGKIVKVLQTEYKHTFKFVLMESLNADVLKAVYGADNVTVTAANGTHGTQVKITKNGKRLGHFSWVIDTTDSELNSFYRNYIPDGQITEVGDVKIVHTDVIAYEVTLECFADASGNFVYTYTDDGQKTTSGS
ncbi:hypothetical protein FZI85_17230 [Mycobacterium sp. CBMA293]|uniref:phage tail tube protein n=1 Tax=unclassified Mycolicibacterium TaxID=2636767 RepID=UPI0012DFA65B|nr:MULTISPECIES: hypothetical protein [unclassified Mycolicibacterium]MUL44467.1 hypothetical protein [Mycolicibacterium sp. CBMA 360]MUL59787.1 hypothetical protein [Mycolicibacterium sp. CBMA 335]MUL68630.1 hypothetical protein [Mycolicibacterium sp. CBMA 311]MUL93979.1 hypothetical protein [Mycolicibacterium sp. CBMA 230]MUM06226.1 hypothetical protein [Mycolicibacterium sp. CBMA 213]